MLKMSKNPRKVLSLGILAFSLLILLAPITRAQSAGPVECDQDGDGYISIPANGADVILGKDFNPNGNYSAAEWDNFFQKFKNDPSSASLCTGLNFKKGAEPSRCDQPMVDPNSGVYDPSKVQSVPGNTVYPTAFDKPGDGIDQNCDGKDAQLVENPAGANNNLSSLSDRVVFFLSRAVVIISIIILIWGGIMYSTAAGDERKTSKARKAIIGAIIGLAIGLLAPSIANFIVASLA